MSKKAVLLLSGGLDSATCLASFAPKNWEVHAVSFDYGQRHRAELAAAEQLARHYQCSSHQVIALNLGQLGGSALTDNSIPVPGYATSGIPVTYVPARNTVFLAYALAVAEVLSINDIVIGVNAIDYSGYPDCRPEFINAFQTMANLATKEAVEGNKYTIHTPLINLSKAEIIQLGLDAGLDYGMTVSCYQADDAGKACGQCDSCRFRKEGFVEVGIEDPTHYQY